MKLPQPLLSGTLIQRYKRFLADINLEDGRVVTAHCPNSGSMKTCSKPGSPVVISHDPNPRRKLKYTWHLVKSNGVWVGINTAHPNNLVKEAIESGIITELQNFDSIRREVKYGLNSRIDLLLEKNLKKCYVEIKNVTYIENDLALFPDAVTARGQKHLNELMNMVQAGHRAVIFFVVQREDARAMAPADNIDSAYGKLLRQAMANGVEAIAYQTQISPEEIIVSNRIPVTT